MITKAKFKPAQVTRVQTLCKHVAFHLVFNLIQGLSYVQSVREDGFTLRLQVEAREEVYGPVGKMVSR